MKWWSISWRAAYYLLILLIIFSLNDRLDNAFQKFSVGILLLIYVTIRRGFAQAWTHRSFAAAGVDNLLEKIWLHSGEAAGSPIIQDEISAFQENKKWAFDLIEKQSFKHRMDSYGLGFVALFALLLMISAIW